MAEPDIRRVAERVIAEVAEREAAIGPEGGAVEYPREWTLARAVLDLLPVTEAARELVEQDCGAELEDARIYGPWSERWLDLCAAVRGIATREAE